MKRLILLVFCTVLIISGCKEPTYNNRTRSSWIERATSTEPQIQLVAVQALGHFPDNDEVANTLKRSLNDPNVGVRYYAAESLWKVSKNHDAVVPALRSVIHDPVGWSYRDRMIPLLRDMGIRALPLVPDIEEAIRNSPNSRVQKWQECLDAIQKVP
jgi:HEAT repeat protein